MFTSAEQAFPTREGGLSSKGIAETNHILGMLESKGRGGKRFRPFAGSVGYCPRENWFYANVDGGPSVTPAPLSLYQGIGNGVEERIVKSFSENGVMLGTQVKLPNPPKHFKIDVGGYIDIIGLDYLGRLAAYEVKTTGTMPTSPKPKHLAQAMVYSVLGGLDVVYLVYVGRQVQNFPDPTPLLKVFQIDTATLLTEYATRILMTTAAVSSLEAPPRPSTFRKSSECLYCDFNSRCWKEEDFPVMSSRTVSEFSASAEKTAEELLKHRPSFFVQLLENCFPSCPSANTEVLSENIAKAKKVSFEGRHL